jgi:Zn-dependent protease with chaperone function
MILFFLSACMCANSDYSDSFLPLPGRLFMIIALVDLILLLFIAHSKMEFLKRHTTFLLLSHGFIFILIQLFEYLKLPGSLFFIITCVIIFLFLLLSRYFLFVRCMAVANCIMLCGIIEKSIFGTKYYDLSLGLPALLTTLGIFVVIGLVYFNLLFKIHTILVCYIISAFLVSSITGLHMLDGNQNDTVSAIISAAIGILIMLTLIYIEFIF